MSPVARKHSRAGLHLLIALILGLSAVTLVFARPKAPEVVWENPPRQLKRGQPFVWRGKLLHARYKQMRLSFSLVSPGGKKPVALGSLVVPAGGSFVFRGRIPSRLKAQTYRVRVEIWRRQAARVVRRNQGSKGPKGAKGSEVSKAPKAGKGSKGKAPKVRLPKLPKGKKLGGRSLPTRDKDGKWSRGARSLWEQLRQGWGPGATSGATKQRKKLEQQRRKTRFLLPPIAADQAPSASPRRRPPASSGPLSSGAKAAGRQRRELPRKNGPGSLKPRQPDGLTPKPRPLDPQRRFGQRPRTPGLQSSRRQGQGAGRGASGQGRRSTDAGTSRSGAGTSRGAASGSDRRAQSRRVPGGPGASGGRSQPSAPTMLPSPSRPPANPAPPGGAVDSRIWTRAAKTRLDLRTKGGNTYLRQVFEPYLPQHQRITVFDRIRGLYRFSRSSTAKRKLRVGGQRVSHRAYFVGRIQVVLFPGRWTALPSVAPDARILWAQSQPATALEFAKDAQDVVYVRSRTGLTQKVRLVFGTDADKGYFGGTLPTGIRVSSYPRRKRAWVPPMIRRVVHRNLHRLGLDRYMELHAILKKIVPFLRGYVARPLKPSELFGDPYLTLVKARAGVCRHRAMVFTVTMQGLGYPARFVANQAHAFAEIQYPNGRWRQIDLGGGDVPHYMGSWRGNSYRPPKDPFPKPLPNPHAPPPQVSSHRRPQQPGAGQRNPNQIHPSQRQRQRVRVVRVLKKRKRRKKKRDYVSHTRLR